MFKSLLVPPQLDLMFEPDELDLDDIQDLDPEFKRMIYEGVEVKLNNNKDHAYKALNTYQGHFKKLYNDLRELANVTSDNFCVYLKLFSVTDANQWRLVRSKMSSIFKPSMRRALNLNASDSF